MAQHAYPHKCKVISLALLLVFVVSVPASADPKPSSDGGGNALKAGSWSLQFQIAKSFQLSSFAGATLSCKRHQSRHSAIRFGLTLDNRFSDFEHFRTWDYQDRVGNYYQGSSDSDTEVGFTLQYLYYPTPNRTANLYLGIGPNVTYAHARHVYRYANSTYDIRKSCGFSVGFAGSLGIEWFVSGRISFVGEYGAVARFVYGERRRDRYGSSYHLDTTRRIDRRFELAGSGVKLGISLYL